MTDRHHVQLHPIGHTLMPSSFTMVVKACLSPVYFEARLVGSRPAARFAIGSSCTWNLILMTSKGPTTNLAAQPAIAPAVASVTGLLFVCFAADIGVLAESTHVRPITRHCVAARIAAVSDEGQRERNA